MNENNKGLSDSELMKMALLSVQRLSSSEHDLEVIFARLEKQGIPEHIAKKAVKDISIEVKKEVVKEAKSRFDYALVSIGIGIGAAILSMIILPGRTIIPVGLIVGGIISAAIAKKRDLERQADSSR